MIRLTIVVVVLLALSAAAAWLADRPGHVVLDWGGWRIETTLAALAAVAVVLTAIVILLHRVWLWLRDRPDAFGRVRDRGRRRKGLEALSRGLVAAAAGDTRDAVRYSEAAGQMLDDPALKLLLAAQSAQLTGNEARAERAFTMMLERNDTAFLGRRGLLVLARRRGDLAEALDHARKAHTLRPGADWVVRELVQLEAASGNFRAAGEAARQAGRQHALPGGEAARLQAAADLEGARQAERNGDAKAAAKLAQEAQQLDPALVPAAVLAARLLIAEGRRRPAVKILTDSWIAAPHGDLADAYLALEPDAPAERRRALARELAAHKPDHPESRILLARAELQAGDAKAARTEIEPLVGEQADPRVCRLMAEIEEAEYGDAASARDWLRRAAAAPLAGGWRCTACGSGAPAWQGACPACATFGSLRWTQHAGRPPIPTLEHAPAAALNAPLRLAPGAGRAGP